MATIWFTLVALMLITDSCTAGQRDFFLVVRRRCCRPRDNDRASGWNR
jgi:hypothetical protein